MRYIVAQIFLFDLRTKRKKCKLHYFEALNTAWDANDSDTVEYSNHEMNYAELPTKENDPEKIGNRML